MKSTSIKDIFTSIKKLPSAFRESSNAFIERFANYCGLQGWRLEVATSIFIALVSLGLNVGFYIYSRKHDSPGPDGLGVFDKGHCSSINWWNRVAHVAINILSTLLVQQSNSCMQKLSAPTRKEIDDAHRRGRWVDIGIHSFRNIWQRNIGKSKITVWWVLGVSSTFLHLFWNSVILTSPASFEYIQLTVTTKFLTDASSYNATQGLEILNTGIDGSLYPDNLDIVRNSLNDTDVWEHLDKADCIAAYAQPFLRRRSDVVVVVEPVAKSISQSSAVGAMLAGSGEWPYAWLCPSGVSFGCATQLLHSRTPWTLTSYQSASYPVKYCLSKMVDLPCTLLYANVPWVVVIVANVVKLICFALTFWLLARTERSSIRRTDAEKLSNDNADPNDVNRHGRDKHTAEKSRIIFSSGDAIASFLTIQDPFTENICLLEQDDMENGLWTLLRRWVPLDPVFWTRRYSKASFRAIGLKMWLSFIVLMLVLPFASAAFLLSRLPYYRSLSLEPRSIWGLGFGYPLGQFLFGSWSNATSQNQATFIQYIMLANLPQLVLSIEQFWWTNHLTCIRSVWQYNSYAVEESKDQYISVSDRGKPLQVTTPLEQQLRVTTPFRWIFLNNILWITLPWLASQAVFYAKIDVLDHWMYKTPWGISQVGYSILGLIVFAVTGFVAVIIAFVIGVWRFTNRITFAGTCSAAIAAACHPRDTGAPHAEGNVLWGEEQPVGADDEVGRCAFTSGFVRYPIEGKKYA